MYLADEVIPNPDPVKPPFITELIHMGIAIWWLLAVVGVVVCAGGIYLNMSGNARVRGGIILGSAAIAAGGFILIYASY